MSVSAGGTPTDTSTSTSSGGTSGSGATTNSRTIDELMVLYDWLPPDALDAFIEAYTEYGALAAWDAVRNDPRYETWFPGNLGPDGRPRYSEDVYAATRAGYEDVLRSMGFQNTDIFYDQITNLIAGEVSPSEFADRAFDVYDRVVSSSEGVRRYYAENFGLGLTTQALLAGALDPTLGDRILRGEVTEAQIGGSAYDYGFNLNPEFVSQLADRGLEYGAAQNLFGQASNLVPILDVLAKRHNDPDDDFDIYEFLDSEFFSDPAQNLRMRRLMAAERSAFANTGSFATEGSALTGLTAQ